jgi:hypothetical protein
MSNVTGPDWGKCTKAELVEELEGERQGREYLQDEFHKGRARIQHLEAALEGAQQTRDALTGILTLIWGQMVEIQRGRDRA